MKFWRSRVKNTLSVSDEDSRSLLNQGSIQVGLQKQSKRDIRRYCCRDYFPCVPARYIMSIMGCFGFLIVYALRVNMSVALVAMVNESASSERPHKRGSSNDSAISSSCQPTAPVFNWGPEDQGGWMQLQAIDRNTSPLPLPSCALYTFYPSQVGYCLLSFMVFSSLKCPGASLPLDSVASTSLVWGWSSRRPSLC